MVQGDKIFPISSRMVRYLFEKAAVIMGRRTWTHQTRRLYYSWLRRAGLPAEAAASMIGDTEAVAERHYLQALDPEIQKDIQRKVPV